MPKVSVIITTYNRASLLPRAVMSILNQTYQDYEVLIIDDASTDNTRDVAGSFRDTRIRYVRKETNGGEASARNEGLRRASGDYIAFQDSDDESIPERLQKQVDVLDSLGSDVGIVYTDMFRIVADGSPHLFKSPHLDPDDSGLYPASLGYTMKNIGIGTSMIRKSAVEKAGLFDENLDYCVDLEYFIRLSRMCRFAHLREPLLKYYESEPDFTKIGRIAAARKIILDKYYDVVKQDKTLHGIHLFYIGNDLCYSGNVSEGRKYIWESIRTDHSQVGYYVALLGSFCGPSCYRGLVDVKNRIFNKGS